MGLLSQYGFKRSLSSADVLTVASDRIGWSFNWFGTTRAVAHNISWGFEQVLAFWS